MVGDGFFDPSLTGLEITDEALLSFIDRKFVESPADALVLLRLRSLLGFGQTRDRLTFAPSGVAEICHDPVDWPRAGGRQLSQPINDGKAEVCVLDQGRALIVNYAGRDTMFHTFSEGMRHIVSEDPKWLRRNSVLVRHVSSDDRHMVYSFTDGHPQVTRIEGDYFFAGGRPVFGHWIAAELAQVGFLELFPELRDFRLVFTQLAPWQRDSLSYFGITDYLELPVEPNAAHFFDFDSLAFPTSMPIEYSYEFVQSHLLAGIDPAAPLTRRLYVSRHRLAGGPQRVGNRQDLVAVCEQFGFEIVAPETLTIAQSIALFSQAELVVAEPGSGIFNFIMMTRRPAQMICLAPSLTDWPTQESFLGYLRPMPADRIEYVWSDPPPADQPHHFNMTLNYSPERLARAIRGALS